MNIDGHVLHKRITLNRVMKAVEKDEGIGLCVACGATAESYCEPDAREYECSSCGEKAVYGAEELLMNLA